MPFLASPRQRSYSALKKIRPVPQPVHTDFKPEEDNSDISETEISEEEYEGDEESEIADDDEQDDNEQMVEKEDKKDLNAKAQLEVGSDVERFRWHTVSVNGRDKILDLKLLEPYMKVISHGGTVYTSYIFISFMKCNPSKYIVLSIRFEAALVGNCRVLPSFPHSR